MGPNEREMGILSDFTREINAEIRATGLAVLSGLVMATPVDTGRARGNWQVSIGAPETDVVENASASVAINGGNVVLQQVAAMRKIQVVYISNNLPYIESLNNGSSVQAPRKFVESVIERSVK